MRRRARTMSRLEQTSFLYGGNATFIAELYARYLTDPQSVDPSWRGFFADLAEQTPAIAKELSGPDWAREHSQVIGNSMANGAANGHAAPAPQAITATILDSLRAVALIRAYRNQGHLIADLDPLGLAKRDGHPDLDPATYGLTEADLARQFFIDGLLGFETATL